MSKEPRQGEESHQEAIHSSQITLPRPVVGSQPQVGLESQRVATHAVRRFEIDRADQAIEIGAIQALEIELGYDTR